MRIVIAADVYPPEVSSAATLMRQLAGELARRGNEVTVVTAAPRHYIAQGSAPRDLPPVADENGVRVVRVPVLPLRKVNFILRGVSQLILPFLLYRAFRRNVRGPVDAVFVYSPPLPMGIAGNWIKRRRGARFVLNIQDIFPQNAIDLGVLRNPLVIRGFEALERFVYRAADAITFHSEGGRRFLIERKGVPPEKIAMVPNWIDLAEYPRSAPSGRFRGAFGLEGKFVLLFGGIMGPAQGLGFLLDVAERLRDVPDIVFLLVGDGMEKPRLEAAVRERGLSNVMMRPFVAAEEYPALVADADAGIVCLSRENHTPFIPGKFLGYLAAGKPVVAFLNRESDGFGLVREAGCGVAVAADDADAAADAVRRMYAERKEIAAMGARGRAYADAHLSVEACAAAIESLMRPRGNVSKT